MDLDAPVMDKIKTKGARYGIILDEDEAHCFKVFWNASPYSVEVCYRVDAKCFV